MVYKINSTELTLQPTSGRWMPRFQVGTDGAGHPIYSPIREFELKWGVLSPSEINQLQTFFETVVTTGTAVVDLPQYMASTYTFFSYSGCTLRELAAGEFFTETILDTSMLITNIRT